MQSNSSESFDNDKLEEIYAKTIESEKLFPVWNWKVDDIELWPLISIRFLSLAGHHFHTGKVKLEFGTPSFSQKQELKLKKLIRKSTYYSLRRKAFCFVNCQLQSVLEMHPSTQRLRKSRYVKKFFPSLSERSPYQIIKSEYLKNFSADFESLYFGNSTATYNLNGVYIQHIVDSERISDEQRGLRTACFVAGANTNSPMITENWFHDTFSFNEIHGIVNRHSLNINYDIRNELEGFLEWEHWIGQETGLSNVGEGVFYNRQIELTIEYVNFFRSLFDHCKNLKKVSQICYYGPVGYALNLVCREKGIECVELQHGVQGTNHRPYHFPNIPKNAGQTLPTHFFNWTEEDARDVSHWGENVGIKAINKGLSWKNFIDQVKQKPDVAKIDTNKWSRLHEFIEAKKKEIANEVSPKKCRAEILLTSFNGEVIPWMDTLLNYCKEHDIFLWWRLHPADANKENIRNEAEKRLAGYPASVLLATDSPLPLLLERVHIHLTCFSSTIIETSCYKIPTITYSKQGLMFYKDNYSKTGLFYCPEISDILKKCDEIVGKKRTAILKKSFSELKG